MPNVAVICFYLIVSHIWNQVTHWKTYYRWNSTYKLYESRLKSLSWLQTGCVRTSGKFSEIVKVHPPGFTATNARRYATVPSLPRIARPCANIWMIIFTRQASRYTGTPRLFIKHCRVTRSLLAGELTFKNHIVESSDDNLPFFSRRSPTTSYSVLFVSRENPRDLDTNPIIN